MSSTSKGLVAAVAFVSIAGVSRMGSAQDCVTEQFNRLVSLYVQFRSDFTDTVPRLRPPSNPQAIEATSNALAATLGANRPDAKVGDIFTPDVAAEFRQRIQVALLENRYAPEDVLRDLTSESPALPAMLEVNGRFDWRFGAAMPGCVIAALPALPAELQYRFVGRDLVLVDIEARLIVDILPGALIVDENH